MPTTGFDHAVLALASMDEAEDLPRRLGFATTPRAVHPFGTGNVLAQFDDHNIEFLAVLDPQKVAADRPEGFSFARFNRDFLERNGPGFSMTVVKSADRETDAARFRAAGFVPEPFSFARAAKAPDGTDARVSFDLVFATHPLLADAGLFTCRHKHPPEMFYKPAYQSHPNTATGVVSVLMAAGEPDRAAALLAAVTGGKRMAGLDGERILFGPDVFDILSPEAMREVHGFAVDVAPGGLRHAGLHIAVSDADATRAALEAGAVAFEDRGRRIVVPPAAASGTGFVFDPAG